MSIDSLGRLQLHKHALMLLFDVANDRILEGL
jgi:hypothetical protein